VISPISLHRADRHAVQAIFNNSIRLLLVERMLDAGADVNIYTNSHGEGVLHYAVRLQREDLMSGTTLSLSLFLSLFIHSLFVYFFVEWSERNVLSSDVHAVLLKAGADITVKGKIEQKTPLELAEKIGAKTIVEKLKQVQGKQSKLPP
jgi:ankyrin repeat protein